jgi:hypothetical protein
VLGSNVDISTLSSDEGFRAINVGTGDVFTSDRATVAEAILQGYFTPPTKKPAATSDEDIGQYPADSNPLGLQRIFTNIPGIQRGAGPPELEFTVDQSNPAAGTFDISLTTPQFAGTSAVNITPATMWEEPATDWFGAFGPSAVDTIKSTVPVLAESAPAWAGGGNWWDEG